ncbi:Uncharacterised protein [Mycobacterium tuberculosis]|nr:Uncharacterised protein [Mycobacterium tuberculosis]
MVPVLPDIGRSQPAAPAEPAAVPLPTASLLIALARVFASPAGTTWSHVSVVTATSLPLRSMSWSIGLGGHHTPPDANVAATLDSSSAFNSMGPRVNEPRFCRLTKSAKLSLLSGL